MKERRSKFANQIHPFSGPKPEKEAEPLVDLVEEPEVLHMYMNLPGIEKEDLNLEVKEKQVKVTATLNRDYEALGDADYVIHEVTYNEFRRRVTLPEEVDPEKTEAKLNKGVLEVELHKKSEAKSGEGHKVEIK